MLLGWATLAWQSDYGQFYLIDREDTSFLPPVDITPEIEARRFFAPTNGLVVYTQDGQQHIDIRIYDAEPNHSPVAWMSGKPWTRVETTRLRFPSGHFSISSPSAPDPLPYGPVFFVHTVETTARISWMEFQGSPGDIMPNKPGMIEIALWPS